MSENKEKSIKIKHGESIEDYFCAKKNEVRFDNSTNNEKCEFDFIVRLQNGMHARPAGKILNIVKKTNAKITLFANDKSASGDSITSIMALGIVNGTTVKVTIEGNNVDKIKAEIEKCLSEEE